MQSRLGSRLAPGDVIRLEVGAPYLQWQEPVNHVGNTVWWTGLRKRKEVRGSPRTAVWGRARVVTVNRDGAASGAGADVQRLTC